MALSATLKLIKENKYTELMEKKMKWVDSRKDNADDEALKVKIIVKYWIYLSG